MTSPTLTVAIAAPHPGVRRALGRLIGGEPDLELVATADDDRGAARVVLHRHPDVLVLASPAALKDGAALVRRLRALAPDTVVVLASTASGEAYGSIAHDAGVAALVPLDGPPERLLDAVRRAPALH